MGYELGWDLIAAAQMASRLRTSEMRFRAVVEAVPSAILLVDDRGAIALANAQAESLFGHSRAELVAMPIDRLVPERLRGAHAGLRALYATDPHNPRDGRRPRAVRLPQGRQRVPGGSGAQPMATDEGLFVLASVVDISRSPAARAGHGAPARRACAPVAGGDAGRAVRIAGPRVEPAADGHPEQCPGGSALSGANPAARRPARRDPVRHREERSPRTVGDPAAARDAAQGAGAASVAGHQRRGRGIAAPDAQRPAQPRRDGRHRPGRCAAGGERRAQPAAAGAAQLHDERLRCHACPADGPPADVRTHRNRAGRRRDQRRRPRRRHSRSRPGAHLRALRDHQGAGSGPGPGHLPLDRRGPRRPAVGQQQCGRRRYIAHANCPRSRSDADGRTRTHRLPGRRRPRPVEGPGSGCCSRPT